MKKLYFLSVLSLLNTFVFAQLNQWTWVSCDNTTDPIGSYGTQGVAANGNKPGARESGYTWMDANGNLWLLGGYGFTSSNSALAELNDLWKYNPTTNQWTWMKGDNIDNPIGVYGTQGVASAINKPGGRDGGISWTDASGNFWMFGGYGLTSTTTSGNLNDIWRYNPTTNQWTWQKGDINVDPVAVYGTQGVSASANTPQGRWLCVGWKDASGNFWMFGGEDVNGYLNDLWKYDPVSNQWTWIKGDNTNDQAGVYGTQGTASATNKPGARYSATTWADNSGNLWMFGGLGFATSNTAGSDDFLNDLWKYNIATNQWTWIKGDNATYQTGVYGTQGTAAANNKPGARAGALSWNDGSGNLWLYGGYGLNSSNIAGFLNDLWKYNISTNQWTWIKGDDAIDLSGVYGTLGTAAATNKPGARYWSNGWTDNSGNFWLMGGQGYSASTQGDVNDLWKFMVSFPTGVNDIPAAENFIKTYPNPVKDNVTVSLTERSVSARFNYQLTDINGSVIAEKKNGNNTQSFDLAILQKGIYIIKVTNLSNGALYIKKIIKQ